MIIENKIGLGDEGSVVVSAPAPFTSIGPGNSMRTINPSFKKLESVRHLYAIRLLGGIPEHVPAATFESSPASHCVLFRLEILTQYSLNQWFPK